MGDVTIRYYRRRKREDGTKGGYWEPCLARPNKTTGVFEPTLMAKLGFEAVACGTDGPAAWAIAEAWNAKWDQARKDHYAGLVVTVEKVRVYPAGSIGEGYTRYKATATFQKKKPRTREDWERGWAHIEPVFGDVDANTVRLEDCDLWYGGDPDDASIEGLLQKIGVRESHRAMKIWRALWNVLVAMHYTTKKDPSLGIRRETPQPRDKTWAYHEIVPLQRRAWKTGKKGLAALLGVAWDSMMSPVDVRGLTPRQLKGDAEGPFYKVDRAKTGQSAIATISRRTERIVNLYLKSLGFELHDDAPIFRTAGAAPGPKGGRRWLPRPYTKDSLGDDFREVRLAVYGPAETRTIGHDFRRSGAVEAVAGQVDRGALAKKMANSIDSNKHLERTYTPGNAPIVRLADEARRRGRKVLAGAKRQQESE